MPPGPSPSNPRSAPALQLTRWSSALQTMQVEAAALKTRLAEAIRHCENRGLLEQWEDFHARLLASDTVLLLLRRDVAALAESLSAASPESVQSTLLRTATDLKRMRREARSLRLEFERSLEKAGTAGNGAA